jgi:signal transduction histidine kinase
MLSEVFIYAPSIGRYRLDYFEKRIAAAHLASLALEAPPDNMVSEQLRKQLLDHAESLAIVLRFPGRKAMILQGKMPPQVDATFNIADATFFTLIFDAFRTLTGDGDRVIRVIGPSTRSPSVVVETVIAERPLRDAMVGYSVRILALSIVISLFTAILVYLTLHALFVRPMRSLMAAMVSFRENPEDATRLVKPGTRTDEIGIAFRELAVMQRGLRAALIQKARLAAVGTAVTKISHDLRNILASAQLVSDHLESTEDPNIKRIAPTLMGSIDRAVALCTKTLSFVQEGAAQLEVTRFALGPLLDELADTAAGIGDGAAVLDSRIDARLELHADRDQFYRVLLNLVRNAFEAGASRVTIYAHAEVSQVIIEISDNGPGLPTRVRGQLFQPFTGSTRTGGSGLGLAIARDLMRGHGGEIDLVRTGDDGTLFRLTLPVEPGQGERPAPALVHG